MRKKTLLKGDDVGIFRMLLSTVSSGSDVGISLHSVHWHSD